MGIVQTNLDGKVLNYFKDVKEASKTLGICRSLIYGVLCGRTTQTHGFQFFDADDYCQVMEKDLKRETDFAILASDDLYVLVGLKNGIEIKIPTKLVDYTVTPAQLEIEI